MTDFFLLLLGAAFVNNFVLVKFLGLCPFMGVSRRLDAAYGMAMATGFVLTLSAALSWMLHHWLLLPLGLDYLRTLAFILVIAAVAQVTERLLQPAGPAPVSRAGPVPAADHDQLRRARRRPAERAGAAYPVRSRSSTASAHRWVSAWCWCCFRRCASAWKPPTCRPPGAARRSPWSRPA